MPATALPKTKIGGGLLQVDVEEFEMSSRVRLDGDELASVFRDEEGGFDFPSYDNAAGSSPIVAIVALAIVELVDEVFQNVGVGHFLKENDVRVVVFYCFVGIGAESAIEGDDTEDGAFMVSAGGAFFNGWCGEASQGRRLIGHEENGKSPDAGDEHREARAEEEEGGARGEEADTSPNPNREGCEGSEGGRHSGVENHRDEMESDGG